MLDYDEIIKRQLEKGNITQEQLDSKIVEKENKITTLKHTFKTKKVSLATLIDILIRNGTLKESDLL